MVFNLKKLLSIAKTQKKLYQKQYSEKNKSNYVHFSGCIEQNYTCHSGSVKKICAVPQTKNLFLTCSEDGTVREFDTRVKHKCPSKNGFWLKEKCSKNILVDYSSFGTQFYCMDINNFYPHYFAVGGTSDSIYLHDRRMIFYNTMLKDYNSSCVSRFSPDGLGEICPDQNVELGRDRCSFSYNPGSNIILPRYENDNSLRSELVDLFVSENSSNLSDSQLYQEDYYSPNYRATETGEINVSRFPNSSEILESTDSSTGYISSNSGLQSRRPQTSIPDIYVTSTKFSNSNGHELLGSWSGKHVYLFDIRNSNNISLSYDNHSRSSNSYPFYGVYGKKNLQYEANEFSSRNHKSPSIPHNSSTNTIYQTSKRGNYAFQFSESGSSKIYKISPDMSSSTLSPCVSSIMDNKDTFNLEYIKILLDEATQNFSRKNYVLSIQTISSALFQNRSQTRPLEISSPDIDIHESSSNYSDKLKHINSILLCNLVACYLSQSSAVWASLTSLLFSSFKYQNIDKFFYDILPTSNNYAIENFQHFSDIKVTIEECLYSIDSFLSLSQSSANRAYDIHNQNPKLIINQLCLILYKIFYKLFKVYFEIYDLFDLNGSNELVINLLRESEMGSAKCKVQTLLGELEPLLVDFFANIDVLYRFFGFVKNNYNIYYKISYLTSLSNRLSSMIQSIKMESSLRLDVTTIYPEESSRFDFNSCLQHISSLLNIIFNCDSLNGFSYNQGSSVSVNEVAFVHKNEITDFTKILPQILQWESKIEPSFSNDKYDNDFERLNVSESLECDPSGLCSENIANEYILNKKRRGSSSSGLSESTTDINRTDLIAGSLSSTELRANTSSPSISDSDCKISYQCESNIQKVDSIRTYYGICNVNTVKDVNFYGYNDEYVISGSDDGNFFIWEKTSTKLVSILKGDSEVVNVIEPHPYSPILAVSGIDDSIYIFSPTSTPYKKYDDRFKKLPDGIKLLWDRLLDTNFILYAKKFGKGSPLLKQETNDHQNKEFILGHQIINSEKTLNKLQCYSTFSFNNLFAKPQFYGSPPKQIDPCLLLLSKPYHPCNPISRPDNSGGYCSDNSNNSYSLQMHMFRDSFSPSTLFNELSFPITSTNDIENSKEILSANEVDRINAQQSRIITRRIYNSFFLNSDDSNLRSEINPIL
ncbi:WD repeat protein iqw1 [Smittium culicis]|uniref:WD repeat protein iqw1 n=1 Tax=Smittium culicis TaxID=133412 RepID=A0A1R1XIA9_9FUNG|nr:WD repeat protein iqw1 [Smittium culicis]